MNIFQIIKKVLDWEFEHIPGESDNDKILAINHRLNSLTDAYKNLTNESHEQPSYEDAVQRFAYIYKYITCHADLVASKLRESRPLSSFRPPTTTYG